MTSLTPKQYRELHDALVDAFNHSSFSRMLRATKGIRLDLLTSPNSDFSEVVDDVIHAAEQEDWIDELLAGAKQANPGNVKLNSIELNRPSRSPRNMPIGSKYKTFAMIIADKPLFQTRVAESDIQTTKAVATGAAIVILIFGAVFGSVTGLVSLMRMIAMHFVRLIATQQNLLIPNVAAALSVLTYLLVAILAIATMQFWFVRLDRLIRGPRGLSLKFWGELLAFLLSCYIVVAVILIVIYFLIYYAQIT